MNNTSGKRRTSIKSKPSGDIESSVSSGDGNSSMSIDTFLHRLDNDVDLNKNKGKRRRPLAGAGASRKNGVLDAAAEGDKHSPIPRKEKPKTPLPKRTIVSLLILLALALIHDTMTSPPEQRLLGSHHIHDFLIWVKDNPGTGATAFIFVYGMGVVLLLPGTPLTLGGGYVYKVAYGWAGGVAIATTVSMAGSLFGSCTCFLLGRYVMRDQVRKWGRKYPLFDDIDIAVSENGFKIMCLLYLTPVLPLGPVAYMCGTTSMRLISFATAKIAALPLMLLYVLIGASTDTFFGDGTDHSGAVEGGDGNAEIVKKIGVDEDTHKKMVLFGLCLSIVSMSLVSHFVKKELLKTFAKKKREKAEAEDAGARNNGVGDLEMAGRNDKLLRRPRGNAHERADSGMHDEEKD